MTEELFATDAYRRSFDAAITEVDREAGRVALARTAFYPGGGGQPHDLGTLDWGAGPAAVTRVKREGGRIWHWLDVPELPADAAEVAGELDWYRRHLPDAHPRPHCTCSAACLSAEFAIPVTGGNMDPGSGGLRLPPRVDLGGARPPPGGADQRGIAAARAVVVEFLGRDAADADPAPIRTAANLIPGDIDPLRVIDSSGPRQAGRRRARTRQHRGSRRRPGATGTESKGNRSTGCDQVVEAPSPAREPPG